MKRIISFLLCVMLLASLTIPVSAAEPEIIFTDESFYHPGFTMEVDKGATLMSCYNNGTSDIYNAYLEGNVQYYWMRNDSYFADGSSLTIREEDRGCQFYCMAALYADADHTQQIGTIYSATFSVPNVIDPPAFPEITTTSLPNAVVGQEYYFQLECTDPDVTYSLFRSSLPDGLNLTQHGEIEGTPTREGMWYVVIMATPEAGEDYAATAEFEFYVVEDGPDYTIEIIQLPKKMTYYRGEKLDMTGLKVRIWTPEGYLDSNDGKYLTYYDGTLDNLGERKVNLKYEDAKAPIYVTVIEAPETTPPATEPKPTETTPPATTEPPAETTVPPTTEAPPEATVPPTTAAPTEPTETHSVQSEPKPSSAPLALAFAGGGAATAGIGGLVLFLLKKKGGRK